MRKTKIICTIGPASESIETLQKLVHEGMNIVRLNFSHGDHPEHLARIEKVKELNKKLDVPVAIMLDTKGPEIRTGVAPQKIKLEEGKEIIVTTRDVPCDANVLSISYKDLPKLVEKGQSIFIADGQVELEILSVATHDIHCKIAVSGEIGSKKNVNVPGIKVDLPAISEQDVEDIIFGAENGIDFVAQSFVKTAEDVVAMRELLRKNGSDAHVIAKIECMQALEDIDEIIKVADGVMVARGDLGVQVPIQKVPEFQKEIIKKCNLACKPVITATQMLESMTNNPRPTRAEVTDVANAILDGSDAIMLSGETANGKYPIRTVRMMAQLALETEHRLCTIGPLARRREDVRPSTPESLGISVCNTARDVGANAIVACTSAGNTARFIARNRSCTTILALTPHLRELRRLNLVWGVRPVLMEAPQNTDDLIEHAATVIEKQNLVKKGDIVVIAAGIPFEQKGNLNLIKVHKI